MSDTSEREDYADLVGRPGWHRFQHYVGTEWGRGGVRFVQAVEKAESFDDPRAHELLRQVMFAQRQILTLMQYPDQRWRALEAQEERPSAGLSRRGPL